MNKPSRHLISLIGLFKILNLTLNLINSSPYQNLTLILNLTLALNLTLILNLILILSKNKFVRPGISIILPGLTNFFSEKISFTFRIRVRLRASGKFRGRF